MKFFKRYLKLGWGNFLRLLALKKFGASQVKIDLNDGKGPLLLQDGSMDYRLFSDIFLYENYNLNLAQTPAYIMDCGANTGISTRYFVKKYPLAKFAAIEPDQRNFGLLKKNLEGSGAALFQAAIHNERKQLQLAGDDLSSYSRRFVETGHGSESVAAMPLQDVFEKLGWPGIDLLKIDIEGGETAMFDTQDPWLSKVNVFVIEFHEYLKPGATQTILSKIFSTGEFRIHTQAEYMVLERLNWINHPAESRR